MKQIRKIKIGIGCVGLCRELSSVVLMKTQEDKRVPETCFVGVSIRFSMKRLRVLGAFTVENYVLRLTFRILNSEFMIHQELLIKQPATLMAVIMTNQVVVFYTDFCQKPLK